MNGGDTKPGNHKHPGLNLSETQGEDHAGEELVFGFWVFLMSDAILFGVLFATYVTMMNATAGGPGAHELFDLRSAFAQTVLLLLSSFTFGMGSLALKYQRQRRQLLIWLAITLLLGLAFLGLELRDFASMLAHGGQPSGSGFASAFFALVPLHGLHVLAGVIWLLAIAAQIFRFGVDRDVQRGLLRLGLFWHFLDIIWVGIFSVVYLGGLA